MGQQFADARRRRQNKSISHSCKLARPRELDAWAKLVSDGSVGTSQTSTRGGGTLAKIQVLMSTYNGERFLPEQLESLALQKDCPGWSLLWRDDGSSDCSVQIMDAFQPAQRVVDKESRLGPAMSFFYLLAAADPEADAFAFCDQDDVWLPDKLSRAWEWLSSQDPGRPALYFARQQLVDFRLRSIRLSPAFLRPPDFRNALVQNIAAGCTIMMNSMARDVILAAPPPKKSMHDWWAYILVSGAGGAMRGDHRPVILYRQHEANVVGASSSGCRRAWLALRRGPNVFLETFQAHLNALEKVSHLLTAEARSSLDLLSQLADLSVHERVRRLSRAHLYRQGVSENVLLWGYFLLGGWRRPDT